MAPRQRSRCSRPSRLRITIETSGPRSRVEAGLAARTAATRAASSAGDARSFRCRRCSGIHRRTLPRRRRTPETTRRTSLTIRCPAREDGEREADRSASLELAEVASDVIELDRVRPAGRGRLAKKIATDRQLIFELVDRSLEGREPRLLGPAQCVVRVVHQANADGPWLTARRRTPMLAGVPPTLIVSCGAPGPSPHRRSLDGPAETRRARSRTRGPPS